ncbi:unnamed protein product [Oppiella nova]|uniref:Uncharacterized protein n=1 Tax=Oppiella nova TaxID=334625 RepID=A0A7R9M0Q3_9ACAR|nr:unnamed protein product [Oppiella nova]CAG2168777.1 unnamed protein product [Oppiella nova]
MEAVIMQLCASFVKGQARIKRTKGNTKEFSKKLAEASFRNVIKIHDRHGWMKSNFHIKEDIPKKGLII